MVEMVLPRLAPSVCDGWA